MTFQLSLTNPEKYQSLISLPSTQSIILPPTSDNIKECADFLLKDGIVGMPTETVYGLSANAFSVNILLKF